MSTPLDLAESTSEKDAGLSVSLLLLEPASWKLKTILPSVRSPACPPFTSCWKHLLKRIQVTERDTAFSTESHCLPNSLSRQGTFNPKKAPFAGFYSSCRRYIKYAQEVKLFR
ncbi:hypothetical protein XENOCAPTIV_029984 [Xenoophorus captivus]|uniref:Uncharacterized protein n=1 Tax=Xenoophorus captivus TaxID=1517983 RepID=A0ABV0QX99_9TELE